MAILGKTQFVLDHKFDRRSSRHSMNGFGHVFHCHHYASLYTQLAEDASFVDARKLLADCSEDTFYPFLRQYYERHETTDPWERLELASQYYAASGLGAMQIRNAGPDSGEVLLAHSHVDEGWMKKWGKNSTPVNHLTRGYIAACFSTAFDRPSRSFEVREVESLVTGAERSRFVVVVK